jgi:hypothetical protein
MGGSILPVKAGIRTLTALSRCRIGELWMEVVMTDNDPNTREYEFTQNI